MGTICIYHANCFDGMCAAWVVSKIHPDAEFIPAQYGDKKLESNLLQDCYENANINDKYIIVDFSLPRELMELMNSKALSMLVLDHHKTAQANCEGLSFCRFDMNESGASLTWKHLFPTKPVPNLVKYIADRDLWKFELPDSETINAYIQSFPMNILTYEVLYKNLAYNDGLAEAIQGGESINRYKKSMVDAMCNNSVIRNCGGYQVPTVNATLLFSEIGNELCKKNPSYPFAASFFIRSDNKRQWSLRSIGEFDVSEVAKKMGGGGHKNAAGFEEEI